jgi:diguanylate cyclase (GGDEF)-like protein
MVNPDVNASRGRVLRASSFHLLIVILVAICAIVATFLLANSAAGLDVKTGGFSGIIAVFLAVCLGLFFWQRSRVLSVSDLQSVDDPAAATERGLRALAEASEFFAGSLNRGDMFRLVSSRIRDMSPFSSSELLLLNETRSHLFVAEVDGPDTGRRKDTKIEIGEGLTADSFSTGLVYLDHSRNIATIPLPHNAEVFGILQLYFDPANAPSERDTPLLKEIGARIAPLVLSSIALERSKTNALTDATTDLPNERAFFLILENQVAEAQRKRDDRPLTILAIDIKRFDEINKKYGHRAGDQVLNFAAQIIKDSLRQMDFFARSSNDEFLVILPTASKEISLEIITRIQTGFFGRKLKITDSEDVEVELNFGWAAFGTDGETPDQLLAIARLRKDQAKSAEPKKVLWFPNEFVN